MAEELGIVGSLDISAIQTSMDQINRTVDKLQSTLNKASKAFDKLDGSATRINSSFSDFSGKLANIDSSLSSINANAASFSSSITSGLNSANSSVKNLQGNIQGLNSAVGGVQSSLNTITRQKYDFSFNIPKPDKILGQWTDGIKKIESDISGIKGPVALTNSFKDFTGTIGKKTVPAIFKTKGSLEEMRDMWNSMTLSLTKTQSRYGYARMEGEGASRKSIRALGSVASLYEELSGGGEHIKAIQLDELFPTGADGSIIRKFLKGMYNEVGVGSHKIISKFREIFTAFEGSLVGTGEISAKKLTQAFSSLFGKDAKTLRPFVEQIFSAGDLNQLESRLGALKKAMVSIQQPSKGTITFNALFEDFSKLATGQFLGKTFKDFGPAFDTAMIKAARGMEQFEQATLTGSSSAKQLGINFVASLREIITLISAAHTRIAGLREAESMVADPFNQAALERLEKRDILEGASTRRMAPIESMEGSLRIGVEGFQEIAGVVERLIASTKIWDSEIEKTFIDLRKVYTSFEKTTTRTPATAANFTGTVQVPAALKNEIMEVIQAYNLWSSADAKAREQFIQTGRLDIDILDKLQDRLSKWSTRTLKRGNLITGVETKAIDLKRYSKQKEGYDQAFESLEKLRTLSLAAEKPAVGDAGIIKVPFDSRDVIKQISSVASSYKLWTDADITARNSFLKTGKISSGTLMRFSDELSKIASRPGMSESQVKEIYRTQEAIEKLLTTTGGAKTYTSTALSSFQRLFRGLDKAGDTVGRVVKKINTAIVSTQIEDPASKDVLQSYNTLSGIMGPLQTDLVLISDTLKSLTSRGPVSIKALTEAFLTLEPVIKRVRDDALLPLDMAWQSASRSAVDTTQKYSGVEVGGISEQVMAGFGQFESVLSGIPNQVDRMISSYGKGPEAIKKISSEISNIIFGTKETTAATEGFIRKAQQLDIPYEQASQDVAKLIELSNKLKFPELMKKGETVTQIEKEFVQMSNIVAKTFGFDLKSEVSEVQKFLKKTQSEGKTGLGTALEPSRADVAVGVTQRLIDKLGLVGPITEGAFVGLEEKLLRSVGIVDRLSPKAEKFREPIEKAKQDIQKLIDLMMKMKFPELRGDESIASISKNFNDLFKSLGVDLRKSFGQSTPDIVNALSLAFQKAGGKFKIPLGPTFFKMSDDIKDQFKQIFGVFKSLLPTLDVNQLMSMNFPAETIKEYTQFLQLVSKSGGIFDQATQPLLSYQNIISSAANVFDKLRLARQLGAPKEVIDSLRAEADSLVLVQEQARLASDKKKELGASETNLGYLTELAIKYLEKETTSFKNLGSSASSAMRGLRNIVSSQANLFKSLTSEMKIGDMFQMTPEGGFKSTSDDTNRLLQDFYYRTSGKLDDLRESTTGRVKLWSADLSKGFSSVNGVFKNNSVKIAQSLTSLRSTARRSSSGLDWSSLFDENTVKTLQSRSNRMDQTLKYFQKNLGSFGKGFIKNIEIGPTTQKFQQELKFILDLIQTVRTRIATGEIGPQQFPLVEQLMQYAVQLEGAIGVLERPYQAISDMQRKSTGKISFDQYSKAFSSQMRSMLSKTQEVTTGIKRPMGQVISKFFEEVFSPANIGRLPDFGEVISMFARDFPSQVKFALESAAKQGTSVGGILKKVFFDPKELLQLPKTLEGATEKFPEIPRVLMQQMFKPESFHSYQETIKSYIGTLLKIPVETGIADVVSSLQVGKISFSDSILAAARTDAQKLRRIKPEYAVPLQELTDHIGRVLRTGPKGKVLGGLLERAGFSYKEVQTIQAYAQGIAGPLKQVQRMMTAATQKGLRPEQMTFDVGAYESVHRQLLNITSDEQELGQMTKFLEGVFDRAESSIQEFIANQEVWSSKSIEDLIQLIDFWNQLSASVNLVTKQLPGIKTPENLLKFKINRGQFHEIGAEVSQALVQALDVVALEGKGVDKILASLISSKPAIIFDILRNGSVKLKTALEELGYSGSGSISKLSKNIDKLTGSKLSSDWMTAFYKANERFRLEGGSTIESISRLQEALNKFGAGRTENISAIFAHAKGALNEAGIAYGLFVENLRNFDLSYRTFNAEQKNNVREFLSLMSSQVKTMATLFQADPLEKSLLRFVRAENDAWALLQDSVKRNGEKLKQTHLSTFNELAKLISMPVEQVGFKDLSRVFALPGMETMGGEGGIQDALMGVGRIKNVFEEVKSSMSGFKGEGFRPFEEMIRSASSAEGKVLTTMHTIATELNLLGEGKVKDLNLAKSVNSVGALDVQLQGLIGDFEKYKVAAETSGAKLPAEFELTLESMMKTGVVLRDVLNLLNMIPKSGTITAATIEQISQATGNLKTNLMRVGDPIAIRDIRTNLKSAFEGKFKDNKAITSQIFDPDASKGFFDQLKDSKSVISGEMEGLMKSMKGVISNAMTRYGGEPRIFEKFYKQASPQLRYMLARTFSEAGALTAEGFEKWMSQWGVHFSKMTATSKEQAANFLQMLSQHFAKFNEIGFMPDIEAESGLASTARAIRSLGLSIKEVQTITDLGFIKEWGKAFSETFKMINREGISVDINLGGMLGIVGKNVTTFASGLALLRKEFAGMAADEVGAVQGTKALDAGILSFIASMEKLAVLLRGSELSFGKFGIEISSPIKDIGQVGKALLDMQKAVEGLIKFPELMKQIDFSTIGKQVVSFHTQLAAATSGAGFGLSDAQKKQMQDLAKFAGFAKTIGSIGSVTSNIIKVGVALNEMNQIQFKSGGQNIAAVEQFGMIAKALKAMLSEFPSVLPELQKVSGSSKELGLIAEGFNNVVTPLSNAAARIASIPYEQASKNIMEFGAQFKTALDSLFQNLSKVNIAPQAENVIKQLNMVVEALAKFGFQSPEAAIANLNKLAMAVGNGLSQVSQQVQTGAQQVVRDVQAAEESVGDSFNRVLQDSDDMDMRESTPGQGVGPYDFLDEGDISRTKAASENYSKAIDTIGQNSQKLVQTFGSVTGETELFIKELASLARVHPDAAFGLLADRLISLEGPLARDTKSVDALRQALELFVRGAREIPGVGSSFAALEQKLADPSSKSLEGLIDNLRETKTAITDVQRFGAEEALSRSMIKSSGKAREFNIQAQQLLTTIEKLGPAFKQSLTTGIARRETFTHIWDLKKNLEAATSPLRQYQGFETVRNLIQDMESNVSRLSNATRGMLTPWDRLSGIIRNARESFVNLMAYQIRWYASMQVFWLGFGQLDNIMRNFGQLNTEVRRVLRVVRDTDSAFWDMSSSTKALANLDVPWAKSLEALSRTRFTSEIRTTFQNLMMGLGATSQEVGETFYQLGSAGLTANESLAALIPTLHMIIGTEGDAQETTKLLSGVFKLYGDSLDGAYTESEKFSRITDVLTAAFRDHMVEADEIIAGMGYVASTAKLSGVSFEEMTAALAVLNDNMLKGSKAGRGLNRVLLNGAKNLGELQNSLLKIAKDPRFEEGIATKLMEGFQELEQAAGGSQFVRPFDVVIKAGDILGVSLEKNRMSVNELTSLMDQVGVVGGRALAILLLRSGDYNKALFQLQYTAFGAGEDMGSIIESSFKRSLNRLEGFAQTIGQRITGIVKVIVSGMGNTFGNLEKIIGNTFKFFGSEIDNARGLMASFMLLVGAQALMRVSGRSLPLFPDTKNLVAWKKGLFTFVGDINKPRLAFKELSSVINNTGSSMNKVSYAFQDFFSITKNASGVNKFFGSIGTAIAGLTGNFKFLGSEQKAFVTGMKLVEGSLTKMISGEISAGDFSRLIGGLSPIDVFRKEFETKPFQVKADFGRLIDQFRKGEIGANAFRLKMVDIQRNASAIGVALPTTEFFSISSLQILSSYAENIKRINSLWNTHGDIISKISKGSVKNIKDLTTTMADPGSMALLRARTQHAVEGGVDGAEELSEAFSEVNVEATRKSFTDFDKLTKRVSKDAKIGFNDAGLSLGKYLGQLIKASSLTLIFGDNSAESVAKIKMAFSKASAAASALWARLVALGRTNVSWASMKALITSAGASMKAFSASAGSARVQILLLAAAVQLFSKVRGAAVGLAKGLIGIVAQMGMMILYSVGFNKLFELFEKFTRGADAVAESIGSMQANFSQKISTLAAPMAGIIKFVEGADKAFNDFNKAFTLDPKLIVDKSKTDVLMDELSTIIGETSLSDLRVQVNEGDIEGARQALGAIKEDIILLKKEASEKMGLNLSSLLKDFNNISKEAFSVIEETAEKYGTTDKGAIKIDHADYKNVDAVKAKTMALTFAQTIVESVKPLLVFSGRLSGFSIDESKFKVVTDFINKRLAEGNIISLKSASIIELWKTGVGTELAENFSKAATASTEIAKSLGPALLTGGFDKLKVFTTMFPTLAAQTPKVLEEGITYWDKYTDAETRGLILLELENRELAIYNDLLKKVGVNAQYNAGDITEMIDRFKAYYENLVEIIDYMGASFAGPILKEFENIEVQKLQDPLKALGFIGLDIGKAFAGNFVYGADSILGKWERSLQKISDSTAQAFGESFMELPHWAESITDSMGSISSDLFSGIGGKLSDGLSIGEIAQRDWAITVRESLLKTGLEYEHYVEGITSLLTQINILENQRQRALNQGVFDLSKNQSTEGDEDSAGAKAASEIAAKMKEELKNGVAEAQKLAAAMENNVKGAIDATIERIDVLTSSINKIDSVVAKVRNTIIGWAEGYDLANNLLEMAITNIESLDSQTQGWVGKIRRVQLDFKFGEINASFNKLTALSNTFSADKIASEIDRIHQSYVSNVNQAATNLYSAIKNAFDKAASENDKWVDNLLNGEDTRRLKYKGTLEIIDESAKLQTEIAQQNIKDLEEKKSYTESAKAEERKMYEDQIEWIKTEAENKKKYAQQDAEEAKKSFREAQAGDFFKFINEIFQGGEIKMTGDEMLQKLSGFSLKTPEMVMAIKNFENEQKRSAEQLMKLEEFAKNQKSSFDLQLTAAKGQLDALKNLHTSLKGMTISINMHLKNIEIALKRDNLAEAISILTRLNEATIGKSGQDQNTLLIKQAIESAVQGINATSEVATPQQAFQDLVDAIKVFDKEFKYENVDAAAKKVSDSLAPVTTETATVAAVAEAMKKLGGDTKKAVEGVIVKNADLQSQGIVGLLTNLTSPIDEFTKTVEGDTTILKSKDKESAVPDFSQWITTLADGTVVLSNLFKDAEGAAKEKEEPVEKAEEGKKVKEGTSDFKGILYDSIKPLGDFKDALEKATASLNNLSSGGRTRAAVVTAQTGGFIPGFGGGDVNHLLAEGGEYVIRKEMVKRYGSQLFRAYNEGKIKSDQLTTLLGISAVKANVEKKNLIDSPVKKFEIDLGGVPFKGLATEDVINKLERGLKRKQMVGRNR